MKRLFQYLLIFVSALIFASLPVLGLHAASTFYQQHNLVSDETMIADHVDPNLINP